MKGFKYIVAFFVCLIFASCAKQEIKPTQNTADSDAPVWRSTQSGAVSSGTEDPIVGEGILDPNDREVSGVGGKTGGNVEIVDPRDNN